MEAIRAEVAALFTDIMKQNLEYQKVAEPLKAQNGWAKDKI
jgi:hypothetical protein